MEVGSFTGSGFTITVPRAKLTVDLKEQFYFSRCKCHLPAGITNSSIISSSLVLDELTSSAKPVSPFVFEGTLVALTSSLRRN